MPKDVALTPEGLTFWCESGQLCSVFASSTRASLPVSSARKHSSDCFVVSTPDDGQGPDVGTVHHVLLLPRLGIAGQQDARRAVAQEDGNRVVVGLGERSPDGDALTSVVPTPTTLETTRSEGERCKRAQGLESVDALGNL